MLAILILSASLSRFSRLNISYFVPTSVFLIGLWTFVFGLIGQLFLGALLIFPVSAFLFMFSLKNQVKPKLSELIKENLNPSIIFFLVFSAWNYLHVARMQFFEWDEFTHWGPTIKSMFLFDVFGKDSPIILNNTSYPPGLAIISYLVLKIRNVWDESYVFWAYQLIFVSILIPILAKFTYKKTGYLIFSAIVLILNSLYFSNVFKTIYADPLLAIVFGYTLYLAASKISVNNAWAKLNFFAAISFLVLIKDFGIVLSLISISVFIFNLIFTQIGNFISSIEIGRKTTLAIATYILCSFGIRFIWSLYLSSGSLSGSSSSALAGSPTYVKAVVERDPTYVKELLNGYLNVLSNWELSTRSGIALNTWQWLVLISMFLMIISLDSKSKRSRSYELGLSFILILGSFGYLFTLFLVYLNIFGSTFTSYQRYASAFFGGAIFYIAAKTVDKITNLSMAYVKESENTRSKIPIIIPAMVASLIIHSPAGFALDYYFSPNQQSDLIRRNFEPLKQKINLAQFDEHDRVGIIAQHTMGFEYYVIQYEVMPASVYQTGFYTWSIGSPSGPEDFWTDQTMTPDRWNEYLSNIDYLLVNNVTKSFIDEFGYYFDETESFTKEPGIYRVIKDPAGNKLVKHI